MMDEERKEQTEYERRRAKRRAEIKKRRRREMQFKMLFAFLALAVLLIAGWQALRFLRNRTAQTAMKETAPPKKIVQSPPEYDVQLLSVNEYSRPGAALRQVRGIVVHYTANPGTTAQQNRDYFEGLSLSGDTYASSHFVIGLEGELIQCIPCNEVAYASNERNEDTVSIECCIPDETGKFAQETYDTLVHLLAWLVGRYDLKTDDVIRHYDVTGKECPKYYVEYPLAWDALKKDVSDYVEKYGTQEEPDTAE